MMIVRGKLHPFGNQRMYVSMYIDKSVNYFNNQFNYWMEILYHTFSILNHDVIT